MVRLNAGREGVGGGQMVRAGQGEKGHVLTQCAYGYYYQFPYY